MLETYIMNEIAIRDLHAIEINSTVYNHYNNYHRPCIVLSQLHHLVLHIGIHHAEREHRLDALGQCP